MGELIAGIFLGNTFLVSHSAGSFTGRLTRRLTFTASTGFDCFFKFRRLDGSNMFHLKPTSTLLISYTSYYIILSAFFQELFFDL
jgi:hypothetical protein